MEMYADVESRGGILEPPGICEVKFKAPDQIIKMHEVRSRSTENCSAQSSQSNVIHFILFAASDGLAAAVFVYWYATRVS